VEVKKMMMMMRDENRKMSEWIGRKGGMMPIELDGLDGWSIRGWVKIVKVKMRKDTAKGEEENAQAMGIGGGKKKGGTTTLIAHHGELGISDDNPPKNTQQAGGGSLDFGDSSSTWT
jgi:hypothetical protein